ncbi:hypothetical protein BJ878DRAFT_339255 [Calycina marina]|uniref:Apple domain-containing protein n=1 Tax=Calycina marina TaxID=1763456 RepID=A0A9P7YUA2_9HELO|nr:hypothetical protein BJ878DRAFT_339255 [Calycina marina]
MPSFTSTLIAAIGILSVASGTPVAVRSVCGVVPTGTVSQTPISQPLDIKTAELCQDQCTSVASCESFMFGLVNGVYTCKLFSVPAASLPPSDNLVAYDIACSAVPRSTIPGATTVNRKNIIPKAEKAPLTPPFATSSLDSCLAACEADVKCITYTFLSGTCKLFA